MEMFIDGAYTPAILGKTRAVLNPRDGALVDTVPEGDAKDAEIALQSANAAFEDWRALSVSKRGEIQNACAAAMRAEKETLANLLFQELGRPFAACVTEIERSADLLDIYAEEAKGISFSNPVETGAAGSIIVRREPVGVVVAIAPFNYPITLLVFKLGAALMAGCTVVAKPAEDTPLSTLKLAEIFYKAGLPKGCFNVVTGDGREIGAALVSHPIPRKIAFTGGTAAGKLIAAEAMMTLKRVTLELGGQSAAILCKDADIDVAVEAIAKHSFANSGQFCYRVNRVYAEADIYDEFLSKLKTRIDKFTLAPAGGEGDLGPLVNEKIFANSVLQTEDAQRKGARILTGGARKTGEGFDQGYYFPPTLIADTTKDMLIMNEETFGPVLGVQKISSPEDALALANASRYGLAGFVFTQDEAKGRSLCEAMEAGSVWLNNISRSSHHVPFGGMKESGIGREKGRYGIEAYLEYKTMYLSNGAA